MDESLTNAIPPFYFKITKQTKGHWKVATIGACVGLPLPESILKVFLICVLKHYV